ncbi:unnamed protein product [Schistosoma margrebowiei]|uniref:Uncharacterized protein n=1 Tax=Schistosoma margrebowiei TaxID=48269 RepID=A0A183M6K1_9TREM|nr:unnamed protein product [Schistosoma margrebowiei]
MYIHRILCCTKISGQFTCGNVACPAGSERLRSWEVNFVYQERGERRNALVKIRLCPPCSEKLNYRYRRRDVTGQQLNSHQGDDERITSQQGTNNDDNNIDSSSTSPSSKRPRIDGTNDNNCDNVKALSSEEKSADLNSVWCCTSSQSGQNGSKRSSTTSTATSSGVGTIKTQDDEFDEYFADMLM